MVFVVIFSLKLTSFRINSISHVYNFLLDNPHHNVIVLVKFWFYKVKKKLFVTNEFQPRYSFYMAKCFHLLCYQYHRRHQHQYHRRHKLHHHHHFRLHHL